MIKKHF